MKEKRNRRIELSPEAQADKKMREYRSLSLRDVGDLLRVSFTTVSHMETGWARIHDEYFLKNLLAHKFTEKISNFTAKEERIQIHYKTKMLFLLIEKMKL